MIRVNLLGSPKPKKKRGAAVSFEGGRTLGILGVVLLLVAGVEYFHYGLLQKQDKDLAVQIQKLQAEKTRLEVIRSDYEKFSRQKELLQELESGGASVDNKPEKESLMSKVKDIFS